MENVKNTLDLEKLISVTFKDSVRVQCVLFRKGMTMWMSDKVITGKLTISDNALRFFNNDGTLGFTTLRIRLHTKENTDETKWSNGFLLRFTKSHLQKIKFSFDDTDFDKVPNPAFKSKNLERHFNKLLKSFNENENFKNGRKLIIFLSKHSGLILSSEFGFDGARILISNIFDPSFLSVSTSKVIERIDELSKMERVINNQIEELIKKRNSIGVQKRNLEQFA